MSNEEVTIKFKKKYLIITALLLLLILAIILCVSSGMLSRFLPGQSEPALEEPVLDANSGMPEPEEEEGTLAHAEEEEEEGQPVHQIPFDMGTLFEDPFFFEAPFFFEDPFFFDPSPVELAMASRISANTVMYTFEAPSALPIGEYTANIALPDGSSVNYECETFEDYPNKAYCYGAAVKTGLEISATLYVSDPNYGLDNIFSPQLLEASAKNAGIDWGLFNTAAENMGMGLKVDNPLEAWNVIGCCVMNSDGELPPGCEALPVGNDSVPDFFGVDQLGNEGAADAIWSNLLQGSLVPTNWEPDYNGEKIPEEELLAKANACATAMGMGNVSSISEAREFYNIARRFDTRVDNDRSWGANLADSLTDFWNDNFGYIFDPAFWGDLWSNIVGLGSDYDWSVWGDFASDAFGSIGDWFTDAGKQMACGGIYAAQALNDFDTPSWCLDDDGDPMPAPDPETVTSENYEPQDLIEPLPDACLEYIDYANSETYFLLAQTTFAGTYTAQYCMDALNVDPGITTSVAMTQPDALYDALIENFEYVGNPAMPDACQAFADWCDSDQLGFLEKGYTGPILEGSMMAVNGCNDPDNWQEKSTWSANQDPPDCTQILAAIDSGESGTLGIYDAIRDAYESGSPYVTNTHCYQVWSERENFNNTPAGQVKACAEAIQYNQPLETVADYMDFLTFMGALGGLWQDDYAANYPGCQTAIDWAYWMGLDQQGINAAGASCDEGGPVKFSQPLNFINPQTYLPETPKTGGGGSGAGGGGGEPPVCLPDGTSCNTCGISSCVITNCECVAIN